jgi:hypothetical protein
MGLYFFQNCTSSYLFAFSGILILNYARDKRKDQGLFKIGVAMVLSAKEYRTLR